MDTKNDKKSPQKDSQNEHQKDSQNEPQNDHPNGSKSVTPEEYLRHYKYSDLTKSLAVPPRNLRAGEFEFKHYHMSTKQVARIIKKRTQAERIVDKFGGIKQLIAAVNEVYPNIKWHRSTVYRWLWPKSRPRGCGGVIPSGSLKVIRSAARASGVYLSSEDFDPGYR